MFHVLREIHASFDVYTYVNKSDIESSHEFPCIVNSPNKQHSYIHYKIIPL